MESEANRRTGRSTRIALRLIADAYANPGQYFKIVDHYPTLEADKHLARMVQELLIRLNLQGFTLSHYNGRHLIYRGPELWPGRHDSMFKG